MDEEQIEVKNELIVDPNILQIKDAPIDKRLILSAIENIDSTNCDEIIQRPAKPSEIVINPSYTNQNSSDATPTHKKDIDILNKNTLGKIQFGQKLKKTFLKTGQGFVLIESTNSSNLPESSTVKQLTSEAINESENVATHETSSMNIDTLDIAIHEEKMPREGPNIPCKLQIQEKHKCPICFKGFESKVSIKRHFQEIHEKPVEIKEISGIEQSPSIMPEKMFQCSLCPKAFKLKAVLKRHFVQVHDKIKPFHCSFCLSKFRYKNKLERHLTIIHEGKKQDTEDTSQISNSSMTYNTLDIAVHEEKMLKKEPEIQETNNSGKFCSICSYVFWKQSDLDEHVASVHEGKKLEIYKYSLKDEKSEMAFPCYFCSEVFEKKDDCKQHALSFHGIKILENQESPTDSNTSENKENLFCPICPICSKRFQNEYDLDSHIVSTHQVKILENFKCHICFKVFKTKDDINRHFVDDHSGKELDIHGTESESEKKFQCLICLKVSKTESYMTKHFSMIHGVNTANIQETHEKSNEIIKNSLKVKQVLEGKKQHEPSQKTNVVKKNIQCFTCFKFFWTQQNLKEHFASAHEGKKQQFLTQKVSDVKKSKVIHLIDLQKKIQCSTCFEYFWTQKNLSEHFASAHVNICQKIMKEKNVLSAPMKTKVERPLPYEFNNHLSKVHEGKKLDIKGLNNVQNSTVHEFKRPLPFEFNNHLSINKNNFPCKICSRICQSNYLLAKHVSTVHEGKNLQVVQPSRESYMIMKENNFLSAPMKTKFEYPLPFENSKIHEGKKLDIKEIDTVQNSTVHEGKNPQVVQPSQNTVEIQDHDPSFLSKYALKPSWLPDTKTWSIKFKCPICFKVLGDKKTLKKHISKLHEKDKPFQCISCPTRFGYKNELESHFSRVHEGKDIDIQDTNDGKNYLIN